MTSDVQVTGRIALRRVRARLLHQSRACMVNVQVFVLVIETSVTGPLPTYVHNKYQYHECVSAKLIQKTSALNKGINVW